MTRLSPRLNDFRNTLWSRAAAAILVLAVIAGATTLVGIEASTSSFSIMGSAYFYYQNGAYHMRGFAYDLGGAPVTDVRAVFWETSANSTGNQTGPYAVSTNSLGEFFLELPVPDSPSVNLTLQSAQVTGGRSLTSVIWGGLYSADTSLYLGYLRPGTIGTVEPLVVVGAGFYSAHSQAMFFSAGPNGTLPQGLTLETCSTTERVGSPLSGRSNCTGLSTYDLGSVSRYWTRASLPDYPGNASSVILQAVNSTGRVVALDFLNPSLTYGGRSTVVSSAPGGPILSDFAIETSFFLPFMAVIGTYWIYTRPRLSGTVDLVLARPITRKDLFLTRIGGATLLLGSAAAAEVLTLSLGTQGVLGEPMPTSLVLSLLAGCLIATIGTASILFLSAHLAETSGVALGFGIALLFIGLFWTSLVLGLLIVAGPVVGGPAASVFLVQSQLVLPAQSPEVTVTLWTGLSPLGTPLGGSVGGVTLGLAEAVGACWILVPLFLAYRLATTRD